MYERGFPRSQLKGSWAGAFGHPQFLPSVYLRLGVDGDGDGRSDIWRSHIDALASIANYLSNAGWKPNLSWGYAASVPDGFDRSGMSTRLVSPRCARVHERHSRWMTFGEWRRLGVVPLGRSPGDNELASLLEPDGPRAHRLPPHHQLPHDSGLQLLQFLCALGGAAGGRDFALKRLARARPKWLRMARRPRRGGSTQLGSVLINEA
jgi:hypothetical protein